MNNLDSINPNDSPKPPKIAIVNGHPARQEVNLLVARQKSAPKKILKKILIFLISIIVILAATVFFRASSLSEKIFVGQKTTFINKLIDFFRGGNTTLIGENLGQINILLLGVGGEGHDGPYLTDTIILAQIRPDIGEASLTSIPRDYLVDLPEGGGQEKINAAFALGLTKNKEMDWDRGGAWARQMAEKISGLKVPYFAVVDFSGFTKAIDMAGGVDINVERDFTDSQYPDSGVGFLPPQTFTAGYQHMDGERALIFARSRHGSNLEGSDFARSLRQQKILENFKQKVFTKNIVKTGSNINNLLTVFADHFHTNLSPAGIYRIYNLTEGLKFKINSLSLDPETQLICPEVLASNGAYVLTPCPDKSEDDVKNFFKNSFSLGKLAAEKSIVWLADSTHNEPAYNTAFRKLTDVGLTVYELTYSKDNLPQTIVYEANSKPATAEFIKNQLHATPASVAPPGVTVSKDKVDVIVVLGQNAQVEAAPPPYIRPPARQATSTPATSTAPSKNKILNSKN